MHFDVAGCVCQRAWVCARCDREPLGQVPMHPPGPEAVIHLYRACMRVRRAHRECHTGFAAWGHKWHVVSVLMVLCSLPGGSRRKSNGTSGKPSVCIPPNIRVVMGISCLSGRYPRVIYARSKFKENRKLGDPAKIRRVFRSVRRGMIWRPADSQHLPVPGMGKSSWRG
jgi:hypothetical protein